MHTNLSRSLPPSSIPIAVLSDREIDLVSGGGIVWDGTICAGSASAIGATDGLAMLVGAGLIATGACGQFADELQAAFPMHLQSPNTGSDMGHGIVDNGTSCGPGIATSGPALSIADEMGRDDLVDTMGA